LFCNDIKDRDPIYIEIVEVYKATHKRERLRTWLPTIFKILKVTTILGFFTLLIGVLLYKILNGGLKECEPCLLTIVLSV